LLLALADPKRSVVPDVEREQFRARGGEHVRVEVFPGASHSLQRDAFDQVIPVVEAFLTE
jgi:pimeloyl-ACP methyl ester carboxylesterase